MIIVTIPRIFCTQVVDIFETAGFVVNDVNDEGVILSIDKLPNLIKEAIMAEVLATLDHNYIDAEDLASSISFIER